MCYHLSNCLHTDHLITMSLYLLPTYLSNSSSSDLYCRLRVFENRILRRKFGPKRDVNGELRRLHNEDLNSLYRFPNIVRVIKSRILSWRGHVARMEEGRSAFKTLTDISTGKGLLGRSMRRW